MDKQQLKKQIEEKHKKQSKAPNFYGIVLCASEVKDYGATKLYNTMVDSWNRGSEEVRKVLVTTKQYDADGNPLWSDINTKAVFKYMDNKTGQWFPANERKINLEREQRREVTLVTKQEGETQLKFAKLTLWGEKVNIEVPVGYQVNFRANGKVDEQGNYKLNSATVTEFSKVSEEKISKDDLLKVVDTFMPNIVVDFDKVSPSQGLLTTNQLVIIKNAMVDRTNKTNDNVQNNVLVVVGSVGGADENEEVTCWIPKSQSLDSMELGDSVVLFAQPNQKQDKLSVNALAVYCFKEESTKSENQREW